MIAAALVLGGGGALAWLLLLAGRPQVDSIEPRQLRVGDGVVLSGGPFASKEETVVLFDGRAAEIVTADAHRIETKVPNLDLAPGEQREIGVQVRVGRKRSAAVSVVVRSVPRIGGLSPDVALPGEEVLVAGGGWAASGVQALFEGMPGQIVVVGSDYVRARVPELALPHGSAVRVIVASGQDRSEPATLILGRLPVLTSVEPRPAALGDFVTLRGRGLRGTPGEHSVLIGGTPALVVGAGPEGIQVLVPTTAQGGETPLEVHVRGLASPALASLSITPPADPIELRFSADPIGDGPAARAAVGAALGPAFVLAASGNRYAAERAAEVVRRLNAAAAMLRERGETALELRLGPGSAAIAVVGAAEPLIEVTNDDAMGYGAPVARGRVAAMTRGRLANWWLALLRDVVQMLGRGERPRNASAFGADGRYLADVYEISAKAGGAVTPAVVRGLRPPVRDGLKTMAFRVPASVPEPRP